MSTYRAYLRVSSLRQAREGLSLGAQEATLRAAAPEGAEIVIYCEQGVSGRKSSRPELDRLMGDVQTGDTVAVVALDRFGRSATNVALNVREIGARGAQFVSLRERVDTSTPSGRFFFIVMAALGEMESELIGERVKATRPAAIRKHGRYFGGIRRYGRETAGGIRYREARVIQERIIPAFLAGTPAREIARELEADHIPTVKAATWRATGIVKLLKRPDLCNLIVIDGELVEGSLDPIISRETWDSVQALFAARATGEPRGRVPAAPYLLDKPVDVRCGCCGNRMRPRTITRSGRPTIYRYVCTRRETYGTGACSMPRVKREVVDSMLISRFRRKWIDEQATVAAIQKAARVARADIESAHRQAEREAMRADERLIRIRRDYTDGGLNLEEWRSLSGEIEEGRAAAQAEVERLFERLQELEAEGPLRDAEQALVTMLDRLGRLADCYDDAPQDAALMQATRSAMTQIVEQVVIHRLGFESNSDRVDNPASVFFYGGPSSNVLVEVVARQTAPGPERLADGSLLHTEYPHFDRVGLPVADIAQMGSPTSSTGSPWSNGTSEAVPSPFSTAPATAPSTSSRTTREAALGTTHTSVPA